MRKTRKMLAILLAAVMAVGLLPTNFGGGTAFAAVAASGTPGSVSFSANAPSNDRDYTVKVQFYVDNAYQSEQTVRLHRDKWDNSTAVSFSASPNSGYTLDKVTNNWGTALASSITLYKNGGDNNTLKAYFKTSGSGGGGQTPGGGGAPSAGEGSQGQPHTDLSDTTPLPGLPRGGFGGPVQGGQLGERQRGPGQALRIWRAQERPGGRGAGAGRLRQYGIWL